MVSNSRGIKSGDCLVKILFYPGDLVTCTGDRVNYPVHENFGRVGSDFFCLLCINISLPAEVSHGMKKKCTECTVLASTGVSFTTSKVLITCDTTYRTSLHNNNCGLRNIQHGVSTGQAHSTINETSSENQSVSATNVVGGYMEERLGGRQRSSSILSLFSCYERPASREL